MFVQIIEGRTSDAAGLMRMGERWEAELRPGATGFLGATIGVTADGRFINLARFESEDAARANSGRPEQGEWWTETEKHFDGEVSFTDTTDITEWLGGGSNQAGFVQVMKSTGVDRATIERFDQLMLGFADTRPDVIGGYRAWTGPDTCVEVAYFTSEKDAREAEKAGMPDDMQAMMDEFGDSMGATEYLDLSDPQLI